MRARAGPAILTAVSLRCLIVDDNAEFLAAARVILEGGGDFTVVAEASTAAEAVRTVDEVDPDLVLLDIDLGHENGFDVARQLAGRARNPTPNVILISAHREEDFAELIAESPVLGFIPKAEFSPARVGELLRST